MIAKMHKCAKLMGGQSGKLSRFVALMSATMVFGMLSAFGDDWTYDSDTGTVTDGVWTFTATVASGNEMTVKTCTACPSELSTLDFSKPVKDANETSYTIVALGVNVTSKTGRSLFGETTNYWKDNSMVNGGTLAELILPSAGLKTINSGAFCKCTALTNIVNFLPDSVTSVGWAAFQEVHAKCDLYANGVAGDIGRLCFKGSYIRSVHFGKGLTNLGNNSNGQGSFEGCNYLTNIVFHPEGSGITIQKSALSMGSTITLKSDLALYGVKTINSGAFSRINVCGHAVVCDNGLQSGITASVTGLSNFNKVHFLGAPPAGQTGTFADYGQSASTKITTYVPYKYRQQWWPYADGYDPEMSDAEKEQLIKREGTTFSSTYATTPSKRPLLLADMPPGLIIMIQ